MNDYKPPSAFDIISYYWDPAGTITEDSSPTMEYMKWREHCENSKDKEKCNVEMLKYSDFTNYIQEMSGDIIAESGYPADVLLEFGHDYGIDKLRDMIQEFDNRFLGIFENMVEFAKWYCVNLGITEPCFEPYVDYYKMFRDWEDKGFICVYEYDNKIYFIKGDSVWMPNKN